MNKRQLLKSALAFAAAATLAGGSLAQDKTIRIGVTAGPHAQIFEQVKKVAERDGLKIQVVEFSDYVQPNAALAAGDLDANSYQHKPYLDQQIADRGYKFTSVGYTVNFPIGIYSKKLRFVELDAAQLPRSLDDLDASAVNTNYAIPAGLHPSKDAIAQESAKSPYVNLIAIREADRNQPWVAKLVKAYQSEDVRKFIQAEFKGAVVPGF